MNDLDAFSKAYLDPEVKTVVKEAKAPEASETEDDALATEADTDADEGEIPDEEKEPEAKPEKPKSAQARINEVVAKQRAAERERDALIERVRLLEAASTKKPEENTPTGPTPQAQSASSPAPSPDELKEDGSPKYKLGEFDPQFIRDLTRYTIAEENRTLQEQKAAEDQRKMVEAAQAELQNHWLQRVEEVEQELPDLREKIGYMEDTFSDIDPAYGEFLAATIMSCDHGPELMYYLSQNIGEAQKIVASGPAAATLAIGRLDAKFVKQTAAEEKSNSRPSAAPSPPPTPNRGSGGRFSVPADTNDLAAFEREYFKK